MSYSSTVLSHSPVLYLPMNEVSGPTLADASGNGHTGSVPGGSHAVIGGAAGFLSGEVGVHFPGYNDSVVFAAGSAFPTFHTWTFDCWLKMDKPSDFQDAFFFFNGVSRALIELQQTGPGAINLDAAMYPGPQAFDSSPFAVPHFNCWHYWAVTFDGVGNVRWYVDGALIATIANLPTSGFTFTPTADGQWLNGTGGSDSFSLMHSAFYPSQISDVDIAALYAAAHPRQDANCFIAPIRLIHGSGHVVFESDDDVTRLRAGNADGLTHDGTTASIFSGGVEKIRVPLPTASAPPKRWIGLDPAGDLAVHDILPVTATHSISPVVPPVPPVTTPSTCAQMRCGAAANMTGHLISLYQHWAGVLNPLSSLAIKFGVGAAIAAGGELIVSAFALEELAGAIFESITSKLTSLLSAATIGLFDSPTPDETVVIQNGAYCALTCDGNVISPTAAQIQAWNDYLTAHSGSFSTLNMQLALFNALLQFTPLLDWQLQAQGATPNLSCGAMTCP